MTAFDHLDADRRSAPGGEPVIVVDASTWRRPEVPMQAVVIGVDRDAKLPVVNADDFDLLVTGVQRTPRPWVSLQTDEMDTQIERLADAARAHPLAATISAQVLRIAEKLPLADALTVESFAYSTLLGGAEFARWRAFTPVGEASQPPSEPVSIARKKNQLILTLADPASRNAMTATMRDALFEALANAIDDPSRPEVLLQGAGKCFSVGGALFEFGTAKDLAQAHAVRTLHSCALALDALGRRATVRLHGACIGSGIEVAATAHRRIATENAWFQLPELEMGLIPGAGGTATISRAIGRHRTLWMILSGKRIGASLAHDWGLVHALEDGA